MNYSESSRILATLAYTSASPGLLTRDLPMDTVLKGIGLRLSGSVVVTWSSTGYAKETSTISDLLSSIAVEVNGGRVVKNVYPHILHMHQILCMGVQGERRCATGTAAKYNNNALTDAGFTIPTSTQYTTVSETVYVPFEHIFCSPDEKGGRSRTWLDLRGKSSAILKLNCMPITNLDKTANLAFSSISFQFQPVCYEAQGFSQQPVEYDFRETFKIIPFAAASNDFAIDLERGHSTSGISLFAREDYAGAGATSTSFRPTNNAFREIRVITNGREYMSTTFQDLQAKNRHGINAAFASSQSRIDGFAHIPFLTEKQIGSSLNTKLDSFQLKVTVAANDATNNIMPVSLLVHQCEVVAYPR